MHRHSHATRTNPTRTGPGRTHPGRTHPGRTLRSLGFAGVAIALALPASAATAAPADTGSAPGASTAAARTTGWAAAATRAPAGDSGLYGNADPAYDGVYRQSWAILGLRSVGRTVPAKARGWLTGQQCANGGFQSYRADTGAACATSNPAQFTGPDSNSTALAAMALRSVGKRSQANKAIAYLKTLQNGNGGFAYYAGGDSDANSTGLALAALRGTGANGSRIAKATGWLKSVQLRCGAPAANRGLVPFQAGGPGNYLASAQSAIGLTTTLPAKVRATKAHSLRCSGGTQTGAVSTRDALLWGSHRALKAGGGAVPSQFGSGKDVSATAQMAIALGSSRQYGATVASAVKVLKRSASSYTNASAAADPAALGTLLVVSAVTAKTTPTAFGGVNLVKELQRTLN